MASENDLARVLLGVLAIIVLVPLLMMLFMMPMMGMWSGGHMADGGMWGAGTGTWLWPLMWLVPFVVVAGIGYIVYRAVRRPADRVSDPAIEELRAAYARGDLTDDEFERRRERLERK